MDELSSNTSQILQDCVELFQSPAHETYMQHNRLELGRQNQTPSFYNSPDIKYFQKIKQKNHFLYHKSKQNHLLLENIRSSKVYDPYNHDSLIERIKTFSVMNWVIPEDQGPVITDLVNEPVNDPSNNSITHNINSDNINSDNINSQNTPHIQNNPTTNPTPELTPLKCASNGWKCLSFSLSSSKNHLLCTYCNRQLFLKFDDDPDQDINHLLISNYLQQITSSGHDENCIWKTFETPLEGIYYPRPYLNTTNELLIRDYLQNLNNLVSNLLILTELDYKFDSQSLGRIMDPDFIKVSNEWLIHRYMKDNKENFSSLLELTPPVFYGLAVLGWSIHIQTFSNQTILLLVCNKCNQRLFLNTEVDIEELKLSRSKVLTPVKVPVSRISSSSIYDLEEEENDLFDPFDHKPWCCNINEMTGGDRRSEKDKETSQKEKEISENEKETSHKSPPSPPSSSPPLLYQYLIEMVKNSLLNIGVDGEYIIDSDILMDDSKLKRRKSFDINDGLERLNKLRRLYLIDEVKKK